MPAPSSAINRFELGSTFEEFDLRMNQMGFIGAKVLRPRVVGKNAADVGKVKIEQLLQNKSTRRTPGTAFARDTWEFDRFAYAVGFYGKEEPLPDEQLAMYSDIVDAEGISAARAEDAVLGEFERDVASAVYSTGTWTGAGLTTAITNEWDDFTNATPVNDVSAAIEKVAVASGLQANALILNRFQYRNLLQCNEIVDRVKYTRTPTAVELRNILADLFDLKYILVAGGFKNTANEGQDASISRIWSDEYVMVAKVAETDDPREPCVGRTFIWSGDGPGAPGDGGALTTTMMQYRDDSVKSTIYQCGNNRDIVICYAEAAHLLSNATT